MSTTQPLDPREATAPDPREATAPDPREATAPDPREATAPEREAPTARLPATDPELVRASYALLDHRARRRAVPRGLAPAGTYLGLEDGTETHLIRLEATITHVGRSVACDVRFEDQRVSRDHAIIVRHGRHARVLDNRSMNGTFVNGYRIVATNLRDGDVIRVGPVVMQYVEVP